MRFSKLILIIIYIKGLEIILNIYNNNDDADEDDDDENNYETLYICRNKCQKKIAEILFLLTTRKTSCK